MMKNSRKIPRWLKWLFTLFMAVMIPVYLKNYGPTNFLYFCDMALLLTFIGIWTESALLISMCAVGMLVAQSVWVADFIATFFGLPLTGMSKYMFQSDTSLFLRSISLFHGWLPFLLIYLVRKTGYDRRGFAAWTVLTWALILICFFWMPGPRADAGLQPVNIDYVWGMNDAAAQTWMPAYAWLALLMAGLPILAFLPTHYLLSKLAPLLQAEEGRVTST